MSLPPTSQEQAVQRPEPVKLQALQTAQPPASQPMNPKAPHADTDDSNGLGLRGGRDPNGPCPGRFCFIIPCPFRGDCVCIPCIC